MIRCYLFLLGISIIWPAWGLEREQVPQPLQPWVDWVLYAEKEAQCPWDYTADERQCAWPSQLHITVDAHQARFEQHWQIFGDSWLPLPGSVKHWPQEVMLRDATAKYPALVQDYEGLPYLLLPAGEYTAHGILSWDKRPEFIQVPTESGLLSLTLDGKNIPIPKWDDQGRLWLRQDGSDDTSAPGETNRLDVRVFRKLADGLPVVLETRMMLDVAGRYREIVLGPVMDTTVNEQGQWRALSLDSELPARLESDGRLRIQVRPGSWAITFSARHHGDIRSITPPGAQAPWPEEEIWAFQPANHLRMVEVQGVSGIDPQQTGLPDEWKKLSAFLVRPGETIHLDQQRRGDPKPAPDELSLERTLWLDFDGKGYTIQDTIHGTMTQGWRLEMTRPAVLGRANVNGQDQFITRLDNGLAGVEVRRGNIQLEADSRIDQGLRALPISGWQQDFHQAHVKLQLPPGWRLLHASGVENPSNTWLNQWKMESWFVLFITVLAVAKLWQWPWGLVAFGALLLSYHIDGAPHWTWLNVVAVMALLRFLPSDAPFRRSLLFYQTASILVLLFMLLPFMVKQTAQSLFPQVEYRWHGVNWQAGDDEGQQVATDYFATSAPLESEAEAVILNESPAPPPSVSYRRKREKSWEYGSQADGKFAKNILQVDPGAQIQTGPGLPRWEWNAVDFHWSGPVEAQQHFSVILLGPMANRVLGLLTVILCGLFGGMLAWRAWGAHGVGQLWQRITPATGSTVAAILLLVALWPGEALQAASFETAPYQESSEVSTPEVPPPDTSPLQDSPDYSSQWPVLELLDTLRERLLEAPLCSPYCAALPRMQMALNAEGLALVLEIHAAAQVSVPLPGSRDQWQPQEVLLNGKVATTLRRDGEGLLWLVLPPGRHQVYLRGLLPARATVQLSLPLLPRQVTFQADGWRVRKRR